MIPITPLSAVVSGSAQVQQGSSASVQVALTGPGPWTLVWMDGMVQHNITSSPAIRQVTPDGTTTYSVTSVSNDYGCTSTAADAGRITGSATVTVIPLAPVSVVAAAVAADRVLVTWAHAGLADSFVIERRASDSGGAYQIIGTVAGTERQFANTGLVADKAYLYRLRAVKTNVSSVASVPDLATTTLFSDNIMKKVTPIRAVYFTELRRAVNAVRALAGLGAAVYTYPVNPGGTIYRAHVEELRQRLAEARTQLLLPPLVLMDPVLPAPYAIIKSEYVTELRGGVQ